MGHIDGQNHLLILTRNVLGLTEWLIHTRVTMVTAFPRLR